MEGRFHARTTKNLQRKETAADLAAIKKWTGCKSPKIVHSQIMPAERTQPIHDSGLILIL